MIKTIFLYELGILKNVIGSQNYYYYSLFLFLRTLISNKVCVKPFKLIFPTLLLVTVVLYWIKLASMSTNGVYARVFFKINVYPPWHNIMHTPLVFYKIVIEYISNICIIVKDLKNILVKEFNRYVFVNYVVN